MEKILRAGKIAILIILGAVVVYLVSVYAITWYAELFSSDQSFAHAFPIEETDLSAEGILVNLSDSDFIEYPILRELVQNPAGGRNIKFDRIQYRDNQRIENFRKKYCSNHSITRYVRWNDTCYQIVIGQM